MLGLWRRHESGCPHKAKGRAFAKCQCPIWCDGEIDGRRVRKSLNTRDWARATRSLGRLEDPSYGLRECSQPGCSELVKHGRCQRHVREIGRAILAYHETHQDVAEGTKRNRKRVLRFFEAFAIGRGFKTVDQIDLETLTSFRS